MDPSKAPLFSVYLRLRPPPISTSHAPPYPSLPSSSATASSVPERFLTVEPSSPTSPDPNESAPPTHITIHPPSESRKRAVEKFGFTRVFEEQTNQLEVFEGTGVQGLVEGVLREGRDGLVATLGVTGSGKSHTILGSKAQRGITQLAMDLLFRSLGEKTMHPGYSTSLVSSLIAVDTSEAQIQSAAGFLESVYGDGVSGISRATTPMTVGKNDFHSAEKSQHARSKGLWQQWDLLGLRADLSEQDRKKKQDDHNVQELNSRFAIWNSPKITESKTKTRFGNASQDASYLPRRTLPQRPSALPTLPDISSVKVASIENSDYAILVSMYEVYNDRIFDLLSHPRNLKDNRRRPLLFKSTEGSDRKVVAGLKKIVCGSYEEALMVLETGLVERRVAGTGSNSVSSRSHGFFCMEVKKRPRHAHSSAWTGSQLTIVDLAGSERARNAKTAGATLAEAGKINESLMYLGQCLQLQSDQSDSAKPSVVPFRQCKLTELLFSNSFPSAHAPHSHHHHHYHHRNAQKGVMIVTADPLGDFNATSQILRYSALAREITVPRIPSVTSIVFHGAPNPRAQQMYSGRTSPNDASSELEAAGTEIEQLNDQLELMALHLAEEKARRREAEANWQRADERAEAIEAEVREECWSDMEKRINEERRRWMNAMGEEADRNDAHLDRKLEILAQGIQIHEDPPSTRILDLEDENAALYRRIAALEREILGRSPTKPMKPTPLQETRLADDDPFAVEDKENEGSIMKLGLLKLVDSGVGESEPKQETAVTRHPKSQKTPGKKMRKLTPRTNVGMRDEELIGLASP